MTIDMCVLFRNIDSRFSLRTVSIRATGTKIALFDCAIRKA